MTDPTASSQLYQSYVFYRAPPKNGTIAQRQRRGVELTIIMMRYFVGDVYGFAFPARRSREVMWGGCGDPRNVITVNHFESVRAIKRAG
jgi:hypothetical protein